MFSLPADLHTPIFRSCLDKIQSTVRPEKIFLLAYSVCYSNTQCLVTRKDFRESGPLSVLLLVLFADERPSYKYELEDRVEKMGGSGLSVFCKALEVSEFSNWLTQNHPFAVKAVCHGHLCYDSGQFELVTKDLSMDPGQTEDNGKALKRQTELALEFMSGAELFIIRKSMAMAMFNLHQATEQILSAIILQFAGIRLQTHSIMRLLTYAQFFMPAVTTLFPRNTEEEKVIFSLLNKAYSDSRYNNEYSIKIAVILSLQEKVQKLMKLWQSKTA